MNLKAQERHALEQSLAKEETIDGKPVRKNEFKPLPKPPRPKEIVFASRKDQDGDKKEEDGSKANVIPAWMPEQNKKTFKKKELNKLFTKKRIKEAELAEKRDPEMNEKLEAAFKHKM